MGTIQYCDRNGGQVALDLLEKEDIRKLQDHLNVHFGAINMQLAEHALKRLAMLDKNMEANALQARAQLGDAHLLFEGIQQDMSGQTMLLRSVQSMVGNLCKLVCGKMQASVGSLRMAISKVW